MLLRSPRPDRITMHVGQVCLSTSAREFADSLDELGAPWAARGARIVDA